MPPRQPAAGTPEGMNAAESLPPDTNCARGAPPRKPIPFPDLASLSRRRASVKVVRPAGRSTLDPGPPPACLEPGPEPEEKPAHYPLTTARSFRDVKPPAQPTLVRTEHLPPPAKTASKLGVPRLRGPPCLASILCHPRSGDVAVRRWLRTYSGRNPGKRSGSPNRLALRLAGHSASPRRACQPRRRPLARPSWRAHSPRTRPAPIALAGGRPGRCLPRRTGTRPVTADP
jgi:hypothetical protein